MNDRLVTYRVEDPWTTSVNVKTIESVSAADRDRPVRYITAKESKRLLASDLGAAEARARQALERDPADPQALFLLGAVLSRKGRDEDARAILEPLAQSQPQMESAWRELGLALARLGERSKAVAALLRSVDLDGMQKDVWYVLGDLLTFPERARDAEAASDTKVAPCSDPRLAEAEAALRDRRLEIAEGILRDVIEARPEHVGALKLLADALLRSDRWTDAKPLLERCLQLAPDFVAARFRYATMLFAYREFRPALPHIDELLKTDPANTLYRTLKALALSWSRQLGTALAEMEAFIDECPCQPGLWLEYGRLLRAERKKNAVDAFKRAIQILPSFFEAYVSLAGVKTFSLDESLIDQVRAQAARTDLAAEDRAQLHFVLGKAFEDLGRYAESFENYRTSNEILCGGRAYGAEVSTNIKLRTKGFFKPAFFRQRAGVGCPADDPIFIVGMPRAGSTLVEQMLASHSSIEGLGELIDLREIVERLAQRKSENIIFPNLLKDFDADRFRSLGQEYMDRTRRRRVSGKPRFTDKLPSNFALVGLIHLILPNAKIIDIRRHPLDCGFSCYKHYFPASQPISYNLRDLGRGYADYVEVMAHFDEVLPGKVHRVIYEHLIDNPENELRRLLDYLGLPFEEQCLRFHETKRLVLTLSVDQVGMPLYKSGIEHWRHYEQWLGPLKEELGYVLDVYPEVPKFYAEVHARWNKPLNLGFGSNRFALVKGIRQVPFENASQDAAPSSD